MANEITKVTDQNGVDHALVDVKGRAATVDLLKNTTGWVGGNELPPDIIHLATSGSGIGETTLTTDASATAFVGELKSNTDYVVKAEGGNRFRVALATTAPANGTTVNIIYDNASVRNHSFNSGAYNYIYLLADYQGTGTLETIKPMLLTEEQYALNPSYRPYHESVELSKYNRSEANILGAKNLFPIDLNTLKAKNTTGTWSDNVYSLNNATITCTVENGYVTEITANSENPISQNANFILFDGNNSTNLVNSLKGKELTLNGCPKNGSNTSYRMLFSTWGTLESKYDEGNGCTIDVPNNVTGMRFDVILYSEYTPNNLKFRPMIRLATDTDPAYVPYAMTNRELTDAVQSILPDNCKIHRYSFSNDTNPKRFSLGNTPLMIIGKHNGGANISVFFVVSDTDTIATIADVGNKFTLTKDANNVYTITSTEAYWSLVFIGDTIPTVTNAS